MPLLRALPDEFEDILRPLIKRLALFLGIGGAVVDPGNTCLVARDVIEDGFHHMRKGAQFAQTCGRRASQVVKTPRSKLSASLLDPSV